MKYESDSHLDPLLKKKWVAALKGELPGKKYKQARGSLEKRTAKNRYKGNCCLGVLCRLGNIPSKTLPWQTNVSFLDSKDAHYSSTGTPTVPVRVMLGLGLRDMNRLVAMNDGDPDVELKPKTFLTIANWIQRNVRTTKTRKPK